MLGQAAKPSGSGFGHVRFFTYPAIYVERNKKWMPTIIEAVKEMPTLFVFGAGHLTGPDGVVRMLRDAGYTVEQLK